LGFRYKKVVVITNWFATTRFTKTRYVFFTKRVLNK
jgi:hypothetical protein